MFVDILLATLLTLSPDDYALPLKRGQSAEVLVHQRGLDVVVELHSPAGKLLDVIDGPTGDSGDERVEIIAAESGAYRLHIRKYDPKATTGTYTVEVREVRSAAATRALLASRRQSREKASAWLRPHSASLAGETLPAFDALASRAHIVGLGEATHGSRELADARLLLTRRLVERHGYRVIALEASTTRMAALAPYAGGDVATPAVSDTFWIGRRARAELVAWVRGWNLAHRDDRVRIVGVDPQDNAMSRQVIDTFLQQAYGAELVARWRDAQKELAAADEQTAVFGDSSVSASVRQFLFELRALIDADSPLLRARFGPAADAARNAAAILADFADFNSSGAHSRDWYMAAAVARSLETSGPNARAVYWAHNAHVAARGTQTAGAILRSAFGCGYAPVAITFGAGSFVAQLPNDLDDRLIVASVPQAVDESVESVLAGISNGPIIAAWPCGVDEASAPDWLRTPHAMHWVGGLWAAASVPSEAYRAFDFLHDFDAVVYLPAVTAEDLPAPHPRVPARVR